MGRLMAKMMCESITKSRGGMEEVKLIAVDGAKKENANWSKWTPSGVLSLSISNPDAHGVIKVGSEYMVDITPVAEQG